MKSKRVTYLALLFFLCFSVTHLPAADAGVSEAETVKGVLKAMWAAIEKGDVKGYAEHIHPRFTAFGETDVYLARGKKLEVRKVAGWLESASGVHTEMHHPEVTVRGGTAWITYYWTDSGKEGGTFFSSRGKSTRIFVKEKGKWLCIHAHHTLVK